MNDWIGLAIIAFLVICGLFALSRLGKPYDLTAEEFEKRAQEGPGLLGAGVIGGQKPLNPALEKAVIAQQDMREGRHAGDHDSGEPPEEGKAGEAEMLDA